MKSTFREKLLTLVGIFALTFILNTIVTNIMGELAQNKLTTIQSVYLPKIALGSALTNTIKGIQRNWQDSVAALDFDILEQNTNLKEIFLQAITENETLGNPTDIKKLR